MIWKEALSSVTCDISNRLDVITEKYTNMLGAYAIVLLTLTENWKVGLARLFA